jgi:hypothetical protein
MLPRDGLYSTYAIIFGLKLRVWALLRNFLKKGLNFGRWQSAGTYPFLSWAELTVIDRRGAGRKMFRMAGKYALSQHARDVLQERQISVAWMERTLDRPDLIEPSSRDSSLESRLAKIPEFGGRVLRVVVNKRAVPNGSSAYILIGQ